MDAERETLVAGWGAAGRAAAGPGLRPLRRGPAALAGGLLLALACLVLAAPHADAQKNRRGQRAASTAVDILGGVTFYDDYLFRGISYSEGKLAVQGRLGVQVTAAFNFTGEVAITSIAHAQAETQVRAHFEVPLGLGGLRFHADVNQYRYQEIACTRRNAVTGVLENIGSDCTPGADLNYEEVGAGLRFRMQFVELKAMVYKQNGLESVGRDTYSELQARIPLLGVFGTAGRYDGGHSFLEFGIRRQIFGRLIFQVSYFSDVKDPTEGDLVRAFKDLRFSGGGSKFYTSISMQF